MEIIMKRDALDAIVQQAMFLGQVQYMTMIEPERDSLKQAEARRYVERRGYKPKILEEWVGAGLISRRKYGDGNSHVYYSLKEIQRQITVTEMVKGGIRNYVPEPKEGNKNILNKKI